MVYLTKNIPSARHCIGGRQYFWDNDTSQMELGLISSHLLCCTGNYIMFLWLNTVQVLIPWGPCGSFKRPSSVSDIRLMFLIQLLLLRRSLYLRGSLLCFRKKKKNFPSPKSLWNAEPTFKLPLHHTHT